VTLRELQRRVPAGWSSEHRETSRDSSSRWSRGLGSKRCSIMRSRPDSGWRCPAKRNAG
jgi:hypothetical protein